MPAKYQSAAQGLLITTQNNKVKYFSKYENHVVCQMRLGLLGWIRQVVLGRFGWEGLVGMVWLGGFGWEGLVGGFGWDGLVGMVWLGWFG